VPQPTALPAACPNNQDAHGVINLTGDWTAVCYLTYESNGLNKKGVEIYIRKDEYRSRNSVKQFCKLCILYTGVQQTVLDTSHSTILKQPSIIVQQDATM
jgi:hypothetical protein